MSLSPEDRAWIAQFMRSEIEASEERTYRRIKDGALSELKGRARWPDGLAQRPGGLNGTRASDH